MNEIEGVVADHHLFIIPNVVDADVVRAQAIRNRDKENESTYVHYHKHGEPCRYHEGPPQKHESYGNVKVQPPEVAQARRVITLQEFDD